MNATIKTALISISLLVTFSCKKESGDRQQTSNQNDISDVIAGKYPSVTIGTQTWMRKNLEVTRYRNGDRIPHVTDSAKWASLTKGAWCWFKNDSTHYAFYGKLYNWYAVSDPRGLAPTGWHIASFPEWDTLVSYLGSIKAGGKLKDTGTIQAGTGLWNTPNTGATNSTGFTGLPGGYCDNGAFYGLGSYDYIWTSTESDASLARYRLLYYNASNVIKGTTGKRTGFYVRCVKD